MSLELVVEVSMMRYLRKSSRRYWSSYDNLKRLFNLLCKLFSSPKSISEEFALDLETTCVFAIVMDGVRDAVDVGDEAVEFDADADA